MLLGVGVTDYGFFVALCCLLFVVAACCLLLVACYVLHAVCLVSFAVACWLLYGVVVVC